MNDRYVSRAKLALLVQIMDDYGSGTDMSTDFDMCSDEFLESEFGLTPTDVCYFRWIQRSRPRGLSPYHFLTRNAYKVCSAIMECIHQGYEGWSMEDQVVIRAFLSDIVEYVVTSDDLKLAVRPGVSNGQTDM